jgi:hypothetical protein
MTLLVAVIRLQKLRRHQQIIGGLPAPERSRRALALTRRFRALSCDGPCSGYLNLSFFHRVLVRRCRYRGIASPVIVRHAEDLICRTRYPDGGRSREAHEGAEPKPASQHSKVSFRRIVTWASEACARIPSLHAIDPSVPDAQRGPRWLKLLKSGYISLDTPRPSTSMPDARSVAKSADDGRIALPRTIPVGSEAEPQGQS